MFGLGRILCGSDEFFSVMGLLFVLCRWLICVILLWVVRFSVIILLGVGGNNFCDKIIEVVVMLCVCIVLVNDISDDSDCLRCGELELINELVFCCCFINFFLISSVIVLWMVMWLMLVSLVILCLGGSWLFGVKVLVCIVVVIWW